MNNPTNNLPAFIKTGRHPTHCAPVDERAKVAVKCPGCKLFSLMILDTKEGKRCGYCVTKSKL